MQTHTQFQSGHIAFLRFYMYQHNLIIQKLFSFVESNDFIYLSMHIEYKTTTHANKLHGFFF